MILGYSFFKEQVTNSINLSESRRLRVDDSIKSKNKGLVVTYKIPFGGNFRKIKIDNESVSYFEVYHKSNYLGRSEKVNNINILKFDSEFRNQSYNFEISNRKGIDPFLKKSFSADSRLTPLVYKNIGKYVCCKDIPSLEIKIFLKKEIENFEIEISLGDIFGIHGDGGWRRLDSF